MQYTKYLLLLFISFTLSTNTYAQLDTTGLIAHWPFDGNLYDNTGRGHDGGEYYIGTPGTPVYVAGVNGQQGKAHQHRTNIITYANTQPDLNIVKHSIAAVIKFDTVGYASILSRKSRWGISYQHNYGLGAWPSATPGNFFYPQRKSSYPYPGPQFSYPNGYTDSTWYFVVITYDSLTYKTYINGQLRNISYAPYNTIDTSSYGLAIGGFFDTQFLQYSGTFSGALDDMRLYNRVLSDSEIVRYPFGFFDTAVVISKMDTVLCSGDSTLNMEHLVSKPFRNNNTFTVQLSDITGSFASPTIIGSSTNNTSGSIPCIIPSTITSGRYLARIVATAPADTSYEYTINIHPTQQLQTQLAFYTLSSNTYYHPTGNHICFGDSINIYPNTQLGYGTGPYTYQWQKNSISIPGATAERYSTGSINNLDTFTIITTSNHSCRLGIKDTSLPLVISVDTIPNVSVTISLVKDTFCYNDTATFYISQPTNTSILSTKKWYVNNKQSSNSGDTALFIYLNSLDTIYCTTSSNLTCATKGFTSSNKVVVTVDSNIAKPKVSITANPGITVPTGTDITFTATATDAGSNPYYQWYKNMQPIIGANSNIYIGIWPSLQTNDIISVVLKNTTAKCLDKDSTFSNTFRVRYTTTSTSTIKKEVPANLFPNPNTGTFTLKAQLPSNDAVNITVNNAIGQVVYKETITPNNSNINTTVKLPDYIPDGVYIIKATNGKLNYNQSLTISR